MTLTFARAVNGVDVTSAVVRQFSEGPQPTPARLAGRWTCRDATDALTSCTTGPVRTAAFHPDNPFVPHRDYLVELNPEHTLQVTDYRGNPYDRDIQFFQVAVK